MSDDEDAAAARRKAVHDLGAGLGWDVRAWLFRDELVAVLRKTLADEGTHIDTGGGPGTADLWVKCGGVEYFVTVTLSKPNEVAP